MEIDMKINVGDTVMFSRDFLRNTGHFTGPKPFAVGCVESIEDFGGGFIIATVKWNGEQPSKVNIKNLVLKNKLHLEPQ